MTDWLLTLGPPAGAGYLRLLGLTCRFAHEGLERVAPVRDAGAVLCAVWHNRLLGPIIPYRGQNVGVVISRSRDGELISRVAARFGFVPLRGSSSRGGHRAVREVLAHLEAGGFVAITPDGPRGPRYRVQPGLAWLARRTGVPVVPLGVGYSRRLVFGSWDRFQVPLPFSRVQLVYGSPLRFGPGDPPERVCETVGRALTEVTEKADRMLGVTSP